MRHDSLRDIQSIQVPPIPEESRPNLIKKKSSNFFRRRPKVSTNLVQANGSPPATTLVNPPVHLYRNILLLLYPWTLNHIKTQNDKTQSTPPLFHHATIPILTNSPMASHHLDRHLHSYENAHNRFLINHTSALVEEILKPQI